MKKIILFVAMFTVTTSLIAQEASQENIEKIESTVTKQTDPVVNAWKKTGNFTFLFNQAAFNKEWRGGGVSSMGANFGLNYDINYKLDKIVWDNKLILAYGTTKIADGAFTKTDDRIELNSLWGKKASETWFYSAFANFRTQMDSGFDPTQTIKLSHFMSPAFLQVGPGMLWKKSDNLKVNIAPATAKMIFVAHQFTQNGAAFGVEQHKTTRFEFGASVQAYYKVTLFENVTMENMLDIYSNYLDKPQNIDVNYQMNMVMKINKYMSANISLQTIYDDNAITKVQVREVFGFGLNYGF